MDPLLPLDILLHVARCLDLKDLLCFRTISRAVYDLIEANLTLWRRFAREVIQDLPAAPHSFNLAAISVAEARALALRPERFERLILPPRDENELEPHSVDMSPIVPESVHWLKTPPGSSVDVWRALPGNRWVCAIVSLENRQYQLSLWDLQAPINPEGISPRCSITCLEPYHPTSSPLRLQMQMDEEQNIVNCMLHYATNPSGFIVEIFQLSWTEGAPTFAQKAVRRDLLEVNQFWTARLDGDHLCVHRLDGVFLWNWKLDTCGIVLINEWESPSTPFLLQLPYIIPRGSPSPELFVIELDKMQNSSSVPILPLTPCKINLLGSLDGDRNMHTTFLGQRWSLSSVTQPDVLVSEFFDMYMIEEALILFTWSRSSRTLTRWPRVPHIITNCAEYLILPSGAILLNSSLEIVPKLPISREEREFNGGTAYQFLVYPTNVVGRTSLDEVSLIVPHSGNITLSHWTHTNSHLYLISGTIVVRVREQLDPEHVFKVAVARAVNLS
ncbi:hypothetical protein DL93DRAFT_276172 [Clavulina sp. PMI_390]|nr:hypothetical protein DL93DRAFT_276172 [Clavulina sp. PMI_390]